MASRQSTLTKDLFSKEDLSLLAKSLKDKQFRALLSEYAEEISDPKNVKQYEEELIKIEKERGVELVFLSPQPGFALAVGGEGEDEKSPVFINICSSDVVQKPSFVNATVKSKRGKTWSVPHAVPKPRKELISKVDNVALSNSGVGSYQNKNLKNVCDSNVGGERGSGKKVESLVHDVVFHPETLELASCNHVLKQVVIQTAMDSLKANFQLKVDHPRELKNKPYVGVPVKSVIKRIVDKDLHDKSELNFQMTGDAERTKAKSGVKKENETKNRNVIKSDHDNKHEKDNLVNKSETDGSVTPEYRIKHINKVDIQDFALQLIPRCGSAWRPQALEVEVQLPGVARASQVDANVWQQSVLLSTDSVPQYKLKLPLPYPVDEDASMAKFDVSTQKLTLTLSVIPEDKKDQILLHSPSDSGIECDSGDRYRTSNSDGDNSSEVSVSSQEDSLREIDADGVFEPVPPPPKATLLPSYNVKQTLENLVFKFEYGNVLPSSINVKAVGESVIVEFSNVGQGHLMLNYYAEILCSPHQVSDSVVSHSYKDGSLDVTIAKSKADLWETCRIGKNDSYTTVTIPQVKEMDTTTGQKTEGFHHFKTKGSKKKEAVNELIGKKEDGAENVECSVRPPRMQRTVSMCDPEMGPRHRMQGPTCSWPRGILKPSNGRTRSYSESQVESTLSLSPQGSLDSTHDVDMLEDSLEENCSSSFGEKKSVRFNDKVSRQLFRSNSSILAQRAKHQRKVMKKRRSQDRLKLGSDQDSDRGKQTDDISSVVTTTTDEDTDATTTDTAEVEDVEDNGSLSSVDLENINNDHKQDQNDGYQNENENVAKEDIPLDQEGFILKLNKKKRRKSKKNKGEPFEPSNNFIFQLDIEA